MARHDEGIAGAAVRRVALITGAGRGLGRAIARELAVLGAVVAVNDVDGAAAEDVAAEIAAAGGEAFAAVADVSVPEDVDGMVADLISREGGVDWLVNNAAVYRRSSGPFWGTTTAEWDRVIASTLTSVFLCSRSVAPVMERQGSGRIVNIGSQAGMGYVAWQGPHYHAAKAAVLHLTRVMAMDLAPGGVTVNAVVPTAVRLEESAERLSSDAQARRHIESAIPMGRLAEPKEVVAAVTFLLSDAASYITGETIAVRGGLESYGLLHAGFDDD